ncbi:hypothetical protein [Streptomyces sp. NPDC003996]
MEEFSLPKDITALTDEELEPLLDGAVKAFDTKAGRSSVTTDDLAKLRELATAVEDSRTEKAERIAAAGRCRPGSVSTPTARSRTELQGSISTVSSYRTPSAAGTSGCSTTRTQVAKYPPGRCHDEGAQRR